uniref:Uncharacterized protein n=1 Tax=Panagrolaimus sp. JU765 TaxID=591449 RepID=A0AC34R867_9BILA
MPILPAPGICMTSFFIDVGSYDFHYSVALTSFIVFIVLLGAVGCACNTAIFYRYLSTTQKESHFFTSKKFIAFLIFLHLTSTIPVLISYKISISFKFFDHTEWVAKNYPEFYVISRSLPCGLLILDKGDIPEYFFAAAIFTIVAHLLFGTTCQILSVRGLVRNLTERFAPLQRELVIAISLQAFLPFICLAVPWFMQIFGHIFHFPILQDAANFLTTLGTLHSFFHFIIIVVVIKPYRKAITDYFDFLSFKRAGVVAMPSAISNNFTV